MIVLRRLYDFTLALAAQPYAMWALALIAFVESSVFPIPQNEIDVNPKLKQHPAWQ